MSDLAFTSDGARLLTGAQDNLAKLWDTRTGRIVNNESGDILRMFQTGFGTLASDAVDLYPEEHRAAIDALDQHVYDTVNDAVYRAGFTNPWHCHPCAHGIYVLDGTLRTHQGLHPAGSFVWFPEGGTHEHGASDDGDCTFLFITNKAFAIHFLGDESDPEAPEA